MITLNLVATAVATPMTAGCPAVGWRNLMFFTVLGFTVTSLLCGFANSLESLILARVARRIWGANHAARPGDFAGDLSQTPAAHCLGNVASARCLAPCSAPSWAASPQKPTTGGPPSS